MTVTPFIHPVIAAYQSAIERHWKVPAPKVVRRTNNGYVVKGANGDSRPFTLDQIKRMTRSISAAGE